MADDEKKAKKLMRLFSWAGLDLTGKTVLDFGCGKGGLALAFHQQGVLVRGVDIDESDIAEGQATFARHGLDGSTLQTLAVQRDDYRTQDHYRLPFDDNTFDAAYAIQVFEHVNELDLALLELKRVLKPEGLMYVEFPATYIPVEPHLKIPFVHWLPRSDFRARYIDFFNKLGLGAVGKGGDHINARMDDFVFYRRHRDMDAILSRYFSVRDAIPFRMREILGARNLPEPPGSVMDLCAWLVDTLYQRSMILEKAETSAKSTAVPAGIDSLLDTV
jgi:ubiquinone/menaquinone biosynthesis C-methylase UbiE